VGRIQHGPPVALGETLPVVWAARSSAMDVLRRTPFFASHIEAPAESIGRGLLISACPRRLPLHYFERAQQGASPEIEGAMPHSRASVCNHTATKAQNVYLPVTASGAIPAAARESSASVNSGSIARIQCVCGERSRCAAKWILQMV
jgi:hypothetical protein